MEKVHDDRSGENDQVTVREEIAPGTPVAVGDKIIAEYRIWNQENRSFVKVDAFREAALRPVQQLSGHTGWGWFSLRRLTFTPQGYRNVKADRTEYYFDSFPEENTTLTEEFFVTQPAPSPLRSSPSNPSTPPTTAPTTPSTASWPWKASFPAGPGIYFTVNPTETLLPSPSTTVTVCFPGAGERRIWWRRRVSPR